MKKTFTAFLTVVLCATTFVTAQNFSTPSGNRQFTSELFQIDEYIKRQDQGVEYSDTDSYKGTPYNNPSYLVGNVYKGDELLANNVALRYNAMADEIEIKESITSNDEDAKLLTKSPDIYVKIVNDLFVFVPYKGGIENGGYFQVLFEGNTYDLFKKLVKDFIPPKTASTSLTRDTPAKFIDKPVYYIVTKNGKFYELPSSKNKKLKVFSENKEAVKSYVKEKGLDLNKEEDLLKVIKHYDTM